MGSKNVAFFLDISPMTLKAHMETLFRKIP